MYVAELNNQWLPSKNAARSGIVKTQVIINKILALGVMELFIDSDKGFDCPPGQNADPIKQLQASQFNSLRMQSGAQGAVLQGRMTTTSQERKRAEKRYSAAKELIGGVNKDIKAG